MTRDAILRAAVSNWLGRLTALAAALLLTPFTLHRLGETQFGLWMLASSVVGYGALLDFGIGGAVIKYVAHHHARGDHSSEHDVVATALSLYFAIGAMAFVLCAAMAPAFPYIFHLPPAQRQTCVILVLFLGAQLAVSIPCSAAGGVLQARERFDVLNAIGVLGTLGTAAATIFILSNGGGLLALAAGVISVSCGQQFAAVFCVIWMFPEIRFGPRGARLDLVRRILSFGSWIFAGNVAYRIRWQSDQIIIGVFLPISSVAPYAIAQRLSGVPQSIAEQFLAGFFPVASQLYSLGDVDRLRSLYLTGTRLTLAIVMSLSAMLIGLAGPFLTVWAGAPYRMYWGLVVLLVCGGVFELSQRPASMILSGGEHYRANAVRWVCTAAAHLTLAVMLVPLFGLPGAAAASLLAAGTVHLALMIPYSTRAIGVTVRELVRQAVLPALLPVLPMGAVLVVLRSIIGPWSALEVGLVGALALLSYAAGYLLSSAGEPERALLRIFSAELVRRASRGSLRS